MYRFFRMGTVSDSIVIGAARCHVVQNKQVPPVSEKHDSYSLKVYSLQEEGFSGVPGK